MIFQSKLRERIRFDRNELAGAFGDIGTDLPLILGIISATNVDVASTFIMFGAMQILTGIIYGIPMAVQPLKAMAVIVISQKVSANVLYGGGLSVGIAMLLLTISGLLSLLNRYIPKVAIRGIQVGLGISLSTLAITKYITGNSIYDYILPLVSVLIILILWNNRRYPSSLIVIVFGIIYALIFNVNPVKVVSGVGIGLPVFNIPNVEDIINGFFLLALPQIPLSMSNSVFATSKTAEDLFPDRRIGITKIGFTYSLMNLINPFFCGIPTCHGTGGLVGQYNFGGRTGGSVIIYGSLYIIIGLFFSESFSEIIKIFPFSILGVILLFEGIGLISFIRDMAEDRENLMITLLVAIISANMKNGYLVGLIFGTVVWYLNEWRKKKSD